MSFPASLTALLQALIRIPSVSPEGETGGSVAGEARMADYVAGLLRELGADVCQWDVQPGRPNVVGVFGPDGLAACGLAAKGDGARTYPPAAQCAPAIAFVPHLDTVGVAGMTVAPFAAELKDGRIYGRGACDTKGPLAAALWALANWSRSPGAKDARINWVFAANMGEEEMSTGASALCQAGFRADFALALEPTDLHIIRAEKGLLRVWAGAEGRACHASTPDQGMNAIYKLRPFLASCEETLAPEFAAARHPDLGGASLNLAVMRGGSELNIVPDHACAGLDVRTHPSFTNADALARIRSAARGLTLTVHRDGPSYALPESHPWVSRLARHARGIRTAPWFSDANILNSAGIPAVAFGPGSIAQAHTKDEFIEVPALEAGAHTFSAFIDAVSASHDVS